MSIFSRLGRLPLKSGYLWTQPTRQTIVRLSTKTELNATVGRHRSSKLKRKLPTLPGKEEKKKKTLNVIIVNRL